MYLEQLLPNFDSEFPNRYKTISLQQYLRESKHCWSMIIICRIWFIKKINKFIAKKFEDNNQPINKKEKWHKNIM